MRKFIKKLISLTLKGHCGCMDYPILDYQERSCMARKFLLPAGMVKFDKIEVVRDLSKWENKEEWEEAYGKWVFEPENLSDHIPKGMYKKSIPEEMENLAASEPDRASLQ